MDFGKDPLFNHKPSIDGGELSPTLLMLSPWGCHDIYESFSKNFEKDFQTKAHVAVFVFVKYWVSAYSFY